MIYTNGRCLILHVPNAREHCNVTNDISQEEAFLLFLCASLQSLPRGIEVSRWPRLLRPILEWMLGSIHGQQKHPALMALVTTSMRDPVISQLRFFSFGFQANVKQPFWSVACLLLVPTTYRTGSFGTTHFFFLMYLDRMLATS